jgi:hypothetical protein
MSSLLVHWKTDKEYRAGCMIQNKASHMSHRLWSKSGSSEYGSARTDDNQVDMPFSSALDDLSLWISFAGERLGTGKVA